MVATLAQAPYTTDFTSFEDARADYELYLELAAAARCSAHRARSTETAHAHWDDVRNYSGWAAYCNGEMGRLSFS